MDIIKNKNSKYNQIWILAQKNTQKRVQNTQEDEIEWSIEEVPIGTNFKSVPNTFGSSLDPSDSIF